MPGTIKLHDLELNEFIKALDLCKGDIFLETDEGDVLNLKSKLCQIMGIANILSNATVGEATIRCVNPEDETLLFRFNLYREIPDDNN